MVLIFILFLFILFLHIPFFTIYSRYLKRVISKRDGCEYLKQVPSIDGSKTFRRLAYILDMKAETRFLSPKCF
jgi:hypothetical protein